MKTPLFHGSCTAIITPWCENGIDYDRFSRLIEHQFENGTAALLVCGTTGENATMSENEHNELVRFAVNASSGRMKIIAGVGSNDTEKALRFAQNAKAVGADGILMVTPYYNKTSQRGLISHFNYVADRVDLPMILYNVPGRTGMSIAPDTYEVLARHPRINGVKEASGDLSLAAEIRSRCGDELNLWSGNDENTIPMMALGAHGVISVASNLVPGVMTKLCALCENGDYPAAVQLYSRYSDLIKALFMETNPIPVKSAMKLAGLDSGMLRLPLIELSEEHLLILRRRMQDLGLIN